MKTELDQLFDEMISQGWTPGAVAGWDETTTIHNYEAILDSGGFYQKTLPLACVAVELLAKHRPDTVRGVMYSVVSAGWLPDTSRSSYRKVQRILDRLRKRRVLPFDWVADNVRSTQKPSSWSGLGEYSDTVAEAYRKDFWRHLPEYVHIICEKDTVAGRLSGVTREYDVRLSPLRGFSSTTFAYEIASTWEEIDKPIFCYYVGDFDPSGFNIEHSIKDRILEYGDELRFRWRRLAVREEHFTEYKIHPIQPKKSDSRYEDFVDQYGQRAAEVEAVPANDLRAMVREAIESHIPTEEWEQLQEIEEEERDSFETMLQRLSSDGEHA